MENVYPAGGVRNGSLGREREHGRDQGKVEVVEAPSRMIVGLYCFLQGSHPVCRARARASTPGGLGPGF